VPHLHCWREGALGCPLCLDVGDCLEGSWAAVSLHNPPTCIRERGVLKSRELSAIDSAV
jgi:hypothetical protein